mmetsp:Transcript_18291/g.25705  ORF Transcript_18291/g.25705 Transcript_18291/m.25705 type:complete len:80 (-) Transcript_18291:177-416(-)
MYHLLHRSCRNRRGDSTVASRHLVHWLLGVPQIIATIALIGHMISEMARTSTRIITSVGQIRHLIMELPVLCKHFDGEE